MERSPLTQIGTTSLERLFEGQDEDENRHEEQFMGCRMPVLRGS